jgi:DNA-binding transcriptional LysR family regulator
MDRAGEAAGERAAPSLYYLRTFHAVATERSFTRAGRQLDLSQPAVSAHIRSLERYFDGRLFEVRQRRVHLTASGQALFAYTQRVFNLLDEAAHTVAATQRGESGSLRLAASPTIGVYLLPPLLGTFKHARPDVDIDVAIAPTAEIVASVIADRAPFGLVEAPVSHRDLLVEPVAEDEMVLVAPHDHPLLLRGMVHPRELANVPLLRRESGSGTRALVDAALQRAGVTPPTLMQLGSLEALKQAVLAGVGVAWLPRLSVARELSNDELRQVRVSSLAVSRTLSVIRRQDTALAPLAKTFVELVRSS